jgi:HAMP domain-containing protein
MQWKPTIRNRLFGGFAGTVLLIALVGGIGAYSVLSLRKSAFEATRVGARLNSLALEIQVHNLEASRRVQNFLNHSKATPEKIRDGYLEEAAFEIHEIESLATSAVAVAPNREMREKFKAIIDDSRRFEQKMNLAVAADRISSGSPAAQQAITDYEEVAEALHESAEDGESAGHDAAQASLDAIDVISSRSTWLVFGIAILGLVVAGAMNFRLSRAVLIPVEHLKSIAEAVSLGNLDVPVHRYSNDEIGDLTDSFSRMVTAVKFFRMEAELNAAQEPAAVAGGAV